MLRLHTRGTFYFYELHGFQKCSLDISHHKQRQQQTINIITRYAHKKPLSETHIDNMLAFAFSWLFLEFVLLVQIDILSIFGVNESFIVSSQRLLYNLIDNNYPFVFKLFYSVTFFVGNKIPIRSKFQLRRVHSATSVDETMPF